MIPAIGFMIGAIGLVICLYVLMRVVEVWEREEVGWGVKGICLITALVTIGAILVIIEMTYDLLVTGMGTIDMMQGVPY